MTYEVKTEKPGTQTKGIMVEANSAHAAAKTVAGQLEIDARGMLGYKHIFDILSHDDSVLGTITVTRTN